MLRERVADARFLAAPMVLGPLAVDRVAEAEVPEGLLVAGDAAGFVDPMTGDGLRFAVRGGELAALSALRVLRTRMGRRARVAGRGAPPGVRRASGASTASCAALSDPPPVCAVPRSAGAWRPVSSAPSSATPATATSPHTDVMIRLSLLVVAVFGLMIVEARRAASNERAQRARGGIEPKHDVYPAMQVAYPGIFVAIACEGLFRPEPPLALVAAGVVVLTAGKLLKWWAIGTLGQFWTFRVIVVPGSTPVVAGPYRFLQHPNYVGVFGELAGAGLIASAPVAGVLGTLMFTGLMMARVRVENRALDAILRRG